MAETLSTISIVSFILAGIMLIITILLGVRFNVHKIIGDLSGRTAKKSIEEMKHSKMRKNVRTRSRNSKKLQPEKKPAPPIVEVSKEDEKKEDEQEEPEMVVVTDEVAKAVTEDMSQSFFSDTATELIDSNRIDLEVTDDLSAGGADGTQVLQEENELVGAAAVHGGEIKGKSGVKLDMLDDEVVIHTNEVIE